MNTTLNHINEYEKELNVLVPWENIEEDYNDLLKQYAKRSIKGFRAGKTPVSTIESVFKNQVKNDLMSICSTRLCRKALQMENIEAGSPIEISDIRLNKNDHIGFKAHFIEMPRFELPDYGNLDLQSETREEKLDEISDKLLEQTQIFLPPSLIENELKYDDIQSGAASAADKAGAEARVKLMLILKKIGEKDNIKVSEKDIEDRMQKVANENDITINQLKEFLLPNGGLSRLADALLAEYVLSYVIDIQPTEIMIR